MGNIKRAMFYVQNFEAKYQYYFIIYIANVNLPCWDCNFPGVWRQYK